MIENSKKLDNVIDYNVVYQTYLVDCLSFTNCQILHGSTNFKLNGGVRHMMVIKRYTCIICIVKISVLFQHISHDYLDCI